MLERRQVEPGDGGADQTRRTDAERQQWREHPEAGVTEHDGRGQDESQQQLQVPPGAEQPEGRHMVNEPRRDEGKPHHGDHVGAEIEGEGLFADVKVLQVDERGIGQKGHHDRHRQTLGEYVAQRYQLAVDAPDQNRNVLRHHAAEPHGLRRLGQGFAHGPEETQEDEGVCGEKQKNRGPAQAEQKSADHGCQKGCGEHDQHDGGKALGRLRRRVGVPDHGHADHRGEAAAEGLNGAQDLDLQDRVRDRDQKRGGNEQQQPGHAHLAPPDLIGYRAADELAEGEARHVGAHRDVHLHDVGAQGGSHGRQCGQVGVDGERRQRHHGGDQQQKMPRAPVVQGCLRPAPRYSVKMSGCTGLKSRIAVKRRSVQARPDDFPSTAATAAVGRGY